MYITVKQLAEKVNNLERFNYNELKQDDNAIIKLTVELSNNGHSIAYYVDTKSGKREVYNDCTVPLSIVRKMNYSKISYREKTKTSELFVYSFI